MGEVNEGIALKLFYFMPYCYYFGSLPVPNCRHVAILIMLSIK